MKGKKTISIITAIVLLLPNLLGTNVSKASADTKDFIITEVGVLEKYVGDDKRVTVPNTVKQIGTEAFKDCTRIEQIILPEGLSEIGNGAFMGCSKLAKLSLPTTLTAFASNYIEGCNNLKEITIPKGVSVMQWDYYQTNGIESVDVDEENEVFSSIDGVVFNKDGSQLLHYPQNKKDDTYELPKSTRDISLADLYRAKYLKHIIFNSNVTRTIMDNGYADVNGSSFLNGTLESFTVPKENKTFCDIDGVLFTKDKKEVIAYPEKRAGEVYIIPKGTKKIGSWAFSKNMESVLNLKCLLIPTSVTEIQEGAAYIRASEGIGHNLDISLFGKKGSVAETYANMLEDIDFTLHFGYYDSDKKGENVLINATDLSLGNSRSGIFFLKSVVLPLSSNQTVTYTSSNNDVAFVTPDNVIIAKGLGEATITAKTKSGKSASCTVTVKLPAPVVEFKSFTSSSITLSWDKITDAKSYSIYRKSNFDDSYKKIGTVTATSYTDKTFLKGSYSNYKVVANHKNPMYSSNKSIMVQVIIPDSPTDIRLTKTDSNDSIEVNITWSATPYSKGYAVYRSTDRNGKYTMISEIEGSYNAEFSDTLPKTGETYYYKILAFSKYKDLLLNSDFSDPVSIEAQ